MRESEFMQTIEDLARKCGWSMIYHTHDSRHSAKGFPDLCIARAPRLIFAELKTEDGKLTPEQAEWLRVLAGCGCECYCWRPGEWSEIESVITGVPA